MPTDIEKRLLQLESQSNNVRVYIEEIGADLLALQIVVMASSEMLAVSSNDPLLFIEQLRERTLTAGVAADGNVGEGPVHGAVEGFLALLEAGVIKRMETRR